MQLFELSALQWRCIEPSLPHVTPWGLLKTRATQTVIARIVQ
jgi:hypothetical protein